MPAYPLLEFGLSIGTWETADYAYPDTGCESGLIIPVGVGREVVAPATVNPWELADGHVVKAKTWSGVVTIEGRRFRAEIAAVGSRYLLGREILDQFEICFEFGRAVRLRFTDQSG